MNKGELRTLVGEYLHRNDFSATLFDRWVEFAAVRIGRRLRGQDNLRIIMETPVASPLVLDPDVRAIRSIEAVSGTGTIRLRSTEQGLNLFNVAGSGSSWPGSTPMVYRVEGFEVELRPFYTVPLSLAVWFQPAALLMDVSTNVVLTAQPQLYLYAVLVEGAIWTQDAQLARGYSDVFESEVAQLNAQGSNVADTPYMLG